MKVDIRKTFFWLSIFLSLYIFGVAAFIEILNYRAGFFLPRKGEYYNNDPRQGLTKWRYNLTINLKESDYALSLYSNDFKETITSSDPNVIIASQSYRENQPERTLQANRENRLHDAVIKFGLMQYPLLLLSFVGLFWALVTSLKREIYLVKICFLLNILSGIALVWRNYFGSLGW